MAPSSTALEANIFIGGGHLHLETEENLLKPCRSFSEKSSFFLIPKLRGYFKTKLLNFDFLWNSSREILLQWEWKTKLIKIGLEKSRLTSQKKRWFIHWVYRTRTRDFLSLQNPWKITLFLFFFCGQNFALLFSRSLPAKLISFRPRSFEALIVPWSINFHLLTKPIEKLKSSLEKFSEKFQKSKPFDKRTIFLK